MVSAKAKTKVVGSKGRFGKLTAGRFGIKEIIELYKRIINMDATIPIMPVTTRSAMLMIIDI